MTGKEYLLNGDLKLLATKLKLSPNHVSMVARGERKSKRVEDALSELVKIRIEEVKVVIEKLNPKKEDKICLKNGISEL